MQLTTIQGVTESIDAVHTDMREMAQLKSDFDCDQLTRGTKGPFLAHQFHFVMRQYSLALYELRRMLIDKERHQRTIERLQGSDDPDADLDILEQQNAVDLLELSIINKRSICRNCEQIRQELIARNGGKAPTNAEYQAEEPAYWKWFLQRQAVLEHKERATGIRSGTWLNIEHLEQPALLDESHQVPMLSDNGLLDLHEAGAALLESRSSARKLLESP